jgi:hypothetical protein
MNWRGYLLGIITAVLSGIIATVAAYYITREAPQKERLVYTIETPFVFESGTNNFTMQNISIANVGDSSAKDVQIVIDASHSGAEIKDQSVVSSSGLASGIVLSDHLPKDVEISLNSLIPKEQIKVSLLLTTKPKDPLVVSVKSDASTAIVESSLTDTRPRGEPQNFAIFISIFGVVVGFVTAVIASLPLKRTRRISQARNQQLSDLQPPN